eukprot:1727463-Rhodomonas_salina.1
MVLLLADLIFVDVNRCGLWASVFPVRSARIFIGILNKSGAVSFLRLLGHVTRYTKQRYSMVPGFGVSWTSNQYRVVPFVMSNLALEFRFLSSSMLLCPKTGVALYWQY